MKTFFLLYIFFSKILFKFDNNEIGLYLQASVSSSALYIGIISNLFSLEGYAPKLIDLLRKFARTGDIDTNLY